MRFDLNNPEKEVSFLICWNNKLDIADCDMNLMTESLSTEINGEKVDYINNSYNNMRVIHSNYCYDSNY